MKSLKVLKFGGTSMGSSEAIRRVIAIIKKPQKDGRIAAVVVSAMSGVTDQLVAIATRAAAKDESYKELIQQLEIRHVKAARALVSKRNRAHTLATIDRLIDSLEDLARGVYLLHELSPAALDYIMSYGERLSAHLLTSALTDYGVQAEYLNACEIITTDEEFGRAVVDFKTTGKAIRTYFRKHQHLQVVTGFIAATPRKAITTLGRGGSDYSASIVGAALDATGIEIWTDVSGVLTADPRKVKDALPIPTMSYKEAVEMSYFGAKVIHPPTMQPALEKNIPILIKNTFEPKAPGTVIGKTSGTNHGLARGISSISDIAVLQVEGSGMVGTRGVAGRLFGALGKARVNVLLISQASSEHSISIAVVPTEAQAAKNAIDEEFTFERRSHLIEEVSITRDLSIIAVVGENLRHQRGVAGRLFETLGRNGINIVALAQGSSELNISVVIDKKYETKALNAVHDAFFSPERKTLNIFLVGTGLVGSTLLKQFGEQKNFLEREHRLFVRIVGIANTARMHLNPEGIPPQSWKEVLSRSRTRMNIGKFILAMEQLALPGSVFVDCTASADVAASYASILGAGISVVTPNKMANSGTLQQYRELKLIAEKHNVRFLYEANVGAGLPVISTLDDLLLSGDRILKIEGVFSGTLSYIFNTFKGNKLFSETVAEAKRLGYTEPDPRSDLSGTDVARKILILARETGLPLELKDVKVESLLSPACRRAHSVEDFFRKLKREDGLFEKKKRAAEKKRKVLRYIATLEKGKAAVRLQAVDETHAFYPLSGSDNIIAFTTERYRLNPLVIKGPGAGAEVTAAGVFADILRTARGI